MKSLNETTNSTSTQSMRDILIFSKPHSKKLLDNMYYNKRALSPNSKEEKNKENPISILDYEFLNPKETNFNTIKKSHSQVNIIDNKLTNNNTINSNNIYLQHLKKNPSNSNLMNDYIHNEDIKDLQNNNKQNLKNKFNVYEKEMALKIKKEIKLEQLRQEKIKKELSEMKNKPTINKTSIKMSKNNIPIYKRLNEINEHYKENINKIREEMNFEKEMREIEKYDNIYKNNDKYNEPLNFNKWINKNNEWENQRKMKLELLKDEIEEFEGDDELKFKPEINKNSERIVRSKGEDFSKRIFVSRDNKNSFVQKHLKDNKPTFTPKINKKFKIRNDYYNFMNENQVEIYYQLYKNNNNK